MTGRSPQRHADQADEEEPSQEGGMEIPTMASAVATASS